MRVDLGPSDLDPEVVMALEADTAHRFWLGKVNVTVALARGQIKAKGPVAKILRLVPIVKPVFQPIPRGGHAEADSEQVSGEGGRDPAEGQSSIGALPDPRRAGGDLARDSSRRIGSRYRSHPRALAHHGLS